MKQTMTDSEIIDWERRMKDRVIAEREHKAKYRGNPKNALPLKGTRKRSEKPVAPSTCRDGLAHHWRIETPNGAACEGVCKHCGMVRQYLAAGSEELYHTPVGHGRRW